MQIRLDDNVFNSENITAIEVKECEPAQKWNTTYYKLRIVLHNSVVIKKDFKTKLEASELIDTLCPDVITLEGFEIERR